jgi:AraC-like DNA-binding protein
VEVSLEDKHFQIKSGDVYIYMASTLVHLLHKSEDAEGVMVEVDLDYIIPVANKVINVENLLFMRNHPCISLSDKQRAHLEYLFDHLWERIGAEDVQEVNSQRERLTFELIKSMGQTFCYEVLNMYFANQPMHPLPQNKKDVIFQNFMLALFRFYREERGVAYYARMQHITPRYFSTIIKEKSGSSALQWIVQMVITEAKQLLEGSDLSIKEIAGQLNFPTQSFFGKYFKLYVDFT